MKFYKKLDIDDYDTIVSKIQTYLVLKGLVDTSHTGYIPLKSVELIIACPELSQSLLKLGLTILSCAIYRTTNNNNQSPVHVDFATYSCRLNIPIMNCEYSSTVYYTGDKVDIKQQDYNEVKYIEYTNAIEIDRVTVDTATVLRIDYPHQVLTDETKTPRICLTIRCNPDPVMLLTKE
jgi:hypothetical protein